jgi:site-specific DNA-cytosine methylase
LGSSQGINAAGADIKAAANHNKFAIECHAANFPEVNHYIADLVDPDSTDYMDAADLPATRFAWFSPGYVLYNQPQWKTADRNELIRSGVRVCFQVAIVSNRYRLLVLK